MLSGLYIAAASALNHAERHDVTANNLANVNTVGFKPQRARFREVGTVAFVPPSMEVGQAPAYGTAGVPVAAAAGATFVDAPSIQQPGALEYTERTGDLAIAGEGFFAVERDGGVYFTRAGNFRIGRDGYIVTADGRGRLLLENRMPVYVGNAEFEVDENGYVTLLLADGSRQPLGQLWLLRPRGGDYGLLARYGDTLFSAPLAAMEGAGDAQVEQGALEKSAASPVKELVELMSAMRAYEASLQFVRLMDAALGQALELARPLSA